MILQSDEYLSEQVMYFSLCLWKNNHAVWRDEERELVVSEPSQDSGVRDNWRHKWLRIGEWEEDISID